MQILKKVSVVICASCKNYRKKRTGYMETFYHCAFDNLKVTRSCIEGVKRSTPRIDEAMLKLSCKDFSKKGVKNKI